MDPVVAISLFAVVLFGMFVGLLAIAVPVVLFLAAALNDVDRQRFAASTWSERGLRPTLEGGWVGHVHGRAVRVRRVSGATERDETKWSVELDLDNADLEVLNVTARAAWRTGDDAFDRTFRSLGAPETIGALDASVRRKLLELTPRVRVHVIAGQLELVSASRQRLASLLDPAVEAARLLDAASAASVPDQLALMVHGDPVGNVRAQALAVLGRVDPERALRVAHEVGVSDSPLVEIERALLLSDGSLLCPIVQDRSLPASSRARAGLAAAQLLEPGVCAALADALAEASDTTLDPAALQLAVRAGPDGIPALLRLVRSFDDETAGGAAAQLGRTADVGVVPEVQQLVERSSTRHAQRLRDAVRSIQARATVGRGELSLSTGERRGGALSMARTDHNGALSEG